MPRLEQKGVGARIQEALPGACVGPGGCWTAEGAGLRTGLLSPPLTWPDRRPGHQHHGMLHLPTATTFITIITPHARPPSKHLVHRDNNTHNMSGLVLGALDGASHRHMYRAKTHAAAGMQADALPLLPSHALRECLLSQVAGQGAGQ